MYNPDLEELIDAALTDGVVTAKERQILYKRAESMGIDLDEFEMVLDARIAKMQKEEARNAVPPANKSNKYGGIRKCPNCGSVLSGIVAKCPDCGYEFVNVDAVSSAERFAEAVQHAVDEENRNSLAKRILTQTLFGGDNKVVTVIKNFPIPNSKEDLFEFIASLEPKANVSIFSDARDEYTPVYKQKYEECLNKAKALFPKDKMFEPYFKKKKKFGIF